MYYTGFADEAAKSIDGQIAATKTLGWSNIESRKIDGVFIHDLPERRFREVCETLAENGVQINCFGSAVANWSWDPLKDEDFLLTEAQLERSLQRMAVLNCKYIRGMSFRAMWDRPAFDPEVEAAVFPKVEHLVRMCEDAGVIYLHENCNNYGGMSYKHTLKLLDRIKSPAFRLVFDTGNPVMNFDRSRGDELDHTQSSWEFYSNVREFIDYVHIKDAVCLEPRTAASGFAKSRFTFPGEGDGDVYRIVVDLLRNGYDGGFSMEPHMALVFHDKTPAQAESAATENYIEYGRRFMALVDRAKQEIAAGR